MMLKMNELLLSLVLLRLEPFFAFVTKSQQGLQSLPSRQLFDVPPTSRYNLVAYSTVLSEAEGIANVHSTANSYDDTFVEDITNKILNGDFQPDAGSDDDVVLPVLHFWSKRRTVEGAETVQMILDRLEDQISSGKISNNTLHCGHYTIAVEAWAKSGHRDSANMADEIVNRMKNRDIKLNRVTYNSWMNAHAIGKNASRVEDILRIMEKDIPNEIMVNDFNILVSTYAKLGQGSQAELFVKSMVDRYNKGESSCLPDLISYNILLDGWAKSKEEGRGTRAEMILDAIEQRQEWNIQPNPRTYVAAMCAVIHSSEENVIERVESIQQRAKARGFQQDAYVLSTLLDAYATQSPGDALEKVDEILEMLEVIDTNNDERTVVYNTALKLFREGRETDAVARAEDLFQKMKTEGAVDEVSYGTMLTLYANDNTSDKSSKERAEELLQEMHESNLKPNTFIMNSVMNAYLRSGEVSKANQLLDQMETAYKNGVYQLAPNVASYTILMNGWAKSKDSAKTERTEDIFERMRSMYESGNEKAQPNLISYVTLVDSFVKSGQAGAAERAEKIVMDMYEEYKQGKSPVKPNAQLVASVIDCWNKSGERNAGERAEKLLNWLIDIYQQENDKSLLPNKFAFTSAITAWAKSRKFGKAARARAILDKMTSLSQAGAIESLPNTHCFTAVINSCAYCENDALEKRDALQIFVDTYKEMTNNRALQPNEVTFSTALLALRNLLPASERRATAVGTVFKRCIEDGMCNDLVLRRLESVVDTKELKMLVGADAVTANGSVDSAQLPLEWKCNARESMKAKTKATRNLMPLKVMN